ncbi:MAG: aminopeptidase [Eubacteriales bacterium]|nr:aminopeptidase [Eubacteriales bacterium]
MNQRYLENYAKLLVQTGISAQSGERLEISFSEESLPLLRLVVDEAYRAGVRQIYYDFQDDACLKSRYENAPDEAFTGVADYDIDVMLKRLEDHCHIVRLEAPNPKLLSDIDPERIETDMRTQATAGKAIQNILMSNRAKWLIAAVANSAWAKLVYPDLNEAEAIEALWETIFKICRCDQVDPIAAWTQHNQELKRRQEVLNTQRFRKLIYQGPGIDFEVGLPSAHVWLGGSSDYVEGGSFMPNIPTEEVFTMPHRDEANGLLTATRPLALHGQIVRDFSLEFKDGVVVKVVAKEGQEVLEKLIAMDEGAKHLGECALVDCNSPIYQSGLLFQNTLFDENAACHFAFGAAYAETLEGAESLSEDEQLRQGMNQSLIHVDFMVGSEKLNITGISADGSKTVVMENGHLKI